MGRPRGGKSNKSMEAAKNEDAGSGGDEEVIPAYKRRGRIPKLVRDGIDEEEDLAAEVEDDGDGTEKVEDSKTGSVENGGKKRRRRRRRKKQAKRGGAGSVTEEKADEPARSPSGFRQHGSRRKSTPRRAAEAGVESK